MIAAGCDGTSRPSPTNAACRTAGVLPQALDTIGFGAQDAKARQRGRGCGGRQGCGEQKAARAPRENVDQVATAGHEATDAAECLPECPHQNRHPARKVEVLERSASSWAEHASGVRFVEHHERVVTLRERDDAPAAARRRRPC